MRLWLVLLLALCVSTQSVFAQSDSATFKIKVFGGEDIVAPTAPTLLGTVISYDQVDLNWTTSYDNFHVSGYVLFRDGLPISTTSQTAYSDVGLTASTTYVYTVRAVDPSFNYSSSSNMVTMTTSAEPVVPTTETSQQQSTAARVVLNELTVTPGVSTSSFFIRTARPARFEMRWGKTGSYELGYIVNDHYVDRYQTTVTDLEPGTTYQYEVIGYTPLGRATVLERGQFTTLDREGVPPPANVGRFSAETRGDDVALTWDSPQTDFSYVRIVRSHLGFPLHLQDGAIIYQGRGSDFIDKDVLSQYSPAYYTAFVVDAYGNVSSGAIARAYATISGEGPGFVPIEVGSSTLPVVPGTPDGTVVTRSPELGDGIKLPDVSDIIIEQGAERYTFADTKLLLESGVPFRISIPADAITVNLKTIIVSMSDPTDSRKMYSFLLRINKDKTSYDAIAAPFGIEGMSQVIIDIYDYKSGVVGTYKKTISFKAGESADKTVPIFPDLIIQKGLPIAAAASAFTLLGILFFLFYRRRRSPSVS